MSHLWNLGASLVFDLWQGSSGIVFVLFPGTGWWQHPCFAQPSLTDDYLGNHNYPHFYSTLFYLKVYSILFYFILFYFISITASSWLFISYTNTSGNYLNPHSHIQFLVCSTSLYMTLFIHYLLLSLTITPTIEFSIDWSFKVQF